MTEPTGTVADYPDEDLLRRSVRTIARNKRGRSGHLPAWSRVGNVFGLGSTYSIQLCRRFDVDPDTGITTPCGGSSPAELQRRIATGNATMLRDRPESVENGDGPL